MKGALRSARALSTLAPSLMNYKALALGAALGFLFAAIPSCNAPKKCSSSNCRGCCNPVGICINPGTVNFCGSGGNDCVQCSPGRSCTNNSCVQVGSDCTSDQDCISLDPRPVCKQSTTYGTPYPSGYCTVRCSGVCPSGSVCVGAQRRYGENDTFCWKTCNDSSDCRQPGYACYVVGSVSACWLDPLPSPDAGPPAPPDLMGAPCTLDDNCRNPPDDGFCQPEQTPNGLPTGYPGGYCSAPCDITPESHCGANGICVSSGGASLCGRRCTIPGQGQGDLADGGCRTSYVCGRLFQGDGGVLSDGVCNPNCNNPGAGCNPGRTCSRDSGYCQ